MNTVSLSRDEARAFLLAQLGLERPLARAKSERGRGALVGRLSGRVEGTTLVIDGLWREESPLDDAALDAALEAHADACGCDAVKRPKRARRT